MGVEDKVRAIINAHPSGLIPSLSVFIEMAKERADAELPYRAASLFALSVGDYECAREVVAHMYAPAVNCAVLAERERCAKICELFSVDPQDGNPAGVYVQSRNDTAKRLAFEIREGK